MISIVLVSLLIDRSKMIHAAVLFSFLVVLQSAFAAPGGKIVGGDNAREGQFPYMASLQYGSFHYCGGSILTKRSILTAAHCLGDSPSAYSVKLGTTSLVGSGVEYQVANYSTHPQYDLNGIIHDVAVLHLTTDIEFTSNIQPITLDSSYVSGGRNSTTSGWGLTSFPGSYPSNLQFINLLTISQDECVTRFTGINFVIHPTHLCTFTRSGEGICSADSGSPLTLDGKQIGVTSWGMLCARGYPDGFARVSVDYDWIMANVI